MVDHYMIYAVRKVNALRLKRNSPKTIEFRALRNYCKEDFIRDLQRNHWVSILDRHVNTEGVGVLQSSNSKALFKRSQHFTKHHYTFRRNV